jgi:hypothetical protein
MPCFWCKCYQTARNSIAYKLCFLWTGRYAAADQTADSVHKQQVSLQEAKHFTHSCMHTCTS